MTDLEVALRAVFYPAAVMLFGTSLFLVYAPKQIERKPALRLSTGAAVAAFISGAAILVVHAAVISGEPLRNIMLEGTLLTALRETTFGRIGALRLALLILLFVVARGPRAAIARAAVAALVVASIAWSGHAIGTPGPLHVLADSTHLLAAGAWLGGLIPLVWALRHSTGDSAIALTARFSQLGIACVSALIVTGWVNAWFLVGDLDALVHTTYGRLLCVKLALFTIMLVFATINRFTLTPRLPQATARQQIAINATIEVALGVLILLVVAALGVMVPGAHAEMHMH